MAAVRRALLHVVALALTLALSLNSPLALALAQLDPDDVTILTGTNEGSVTLTISEGTGPPTGPYTTYSSKITLTGTADLDDDDDATASLSGSLSSSPSPTGDDDDIISLTGTSFPTTATFAGNFSLSASASVSASTPTATNTRPCNNYVEFCDRRWSNVSMVAAHNSPFVREGNAAANQHFGVTTQLDDGVRFLQAQMHFVGDVPHFCHSSCDILDAGPITDWLGEVKRWVDGHPFDVVTILIGNGPYAPVERFIPYIERTGILRYAYRAPFLPMALDDWPTLAELIITGKRVIFFLDYMADQRRHSWLHDQFSQMWESPFDPLDRSFPCVVQRPPDLPRDAARDRLYMINHNLNVQFTVFGASILVPAVNLLNETNAADGDGSLGESARRCVDDWGRPPNFLNVDYYNFGKPPGSVFEVTARMNGVEYDRECCGKASAAHVLLLRPGRHVLAAVGAVAAVALLWA